MNNAMMKCPNCGGAIIIDKNNEYKCPYCGQKFGFAPNKEKEKADSQTSFRGNLLTALSIAPLFILLFLQPDDSMNVILLFSIILVTLLFSLITGIIAIARFKKKLGIIGIIGSTVLLIYLAVNVANGYIMGVQEKAEKYESPYLYYDEASINHPERFIAPSEDFCKNALRTIDSISDFSQVTEYHDPNHGLSLEDGYYACFVFEVKDIDLNQIDGYDLIDKGNDSGGTIELYRNEEDAKKRLEKFADARKNGVGGCGKVGTVIFRTSSLLSSKEQQELFEKIVQAMDED